MRLEVIALLAMAYFIVVAVRRRKTVMARLFMDDY